MMKLAWRGRNMSLVCTGEDDRTSIDNREHLMACAYLDSHVEARSAYQPSKLESKYY